MSYSPALRPSDVLKIIAVSALVTVLVTRHWEAMLIMFGFLSWSLVLGAQVSAGIHKPERDP